MAHFPQARFLLSARRAQDFVPDTGAEVAFAGRSNSGKSSAINAIAGRVALARTSKSPGQTRLINFFELMPGQRLVDLPGYGFAQVSRATQAGWDRLVSDYLTRRGSLLGLFVVVDARRGLRVEDHVLIDLFLTRERTVHVLLSKADTLRRHEAAHVLAATHAELASTGKAQLFSARSKQGVEVARQALKRLFAQEKTRRQSTAAGPD
jgi:GTP-binding protein